MELLTLVALWSFVVWYHSLLHHALSEVSNENFNCHEGQNWENTTLGGNILKIVFTADSVQHRCKQGQEFMKHKQNSFNFG